MADPLAERLKRFTPDAAGLGRDALIFRAGQASARRSRAWIALAGALALTQALTLALLWPGGGPPAQQGEERVSPRMAERPAPVVPDEPSDPGALRRYLYAEEGDLPAPVAAEGLVPDDPPLRAFASPQVPPLD